ncbi:OmpA family protein [Muricoccus radiodurans]|uniref:OmpA family protein n=1 Tax=Muricoccus radiodurans TaxID=2231721 RepID=UPI003CF5E7E8
MTRQPLALLLLGAAMLGGAVAPAAAQSGSALDMIERLRPGSGTRGIRMPGAEPPAAAPAAPAAPAQPYSGAPAQSSSSSGAQPNPVAARPPVQPRPATPRPPVNAAPTTTAPSDVPAVSITIQFPTGSSVLTPVAERALAPLGQALSSAALAPYRFRIEGHTDTVGDDEMNRELSQRRAETVRNFLMLRYGVAAERLEAVGLGESQLLIQTGDNRPEARNRRVQVLNIGS